MQGGMNPYLHNVRTANTGKKLLLLYKEKVL